MIKQCVSLALLLALLPFSLAAQTTAEGAKKFKGKKPKNIILMIGDGTGLAQWCAAMATQNSMLAVFDWATFVGLSLTASANDWITDSAAGATAFSAGQKTNNGMISVAPDTSKLKTIVEMAEAKGLKTGLVATCALQHATPAAFYAHNVSRKNYVEIGNDFWNSGVDFAAGGGYVHFDSTKLKNSDYKIGFQNSIINYNLNSAAQANTKQIWFYDKNEHPPSLQLGRTTGWLNSASITAINSINNKKGFFLMIEGSQIDWGGHDNDSNYVVTETLEFDSVIRNVMKWAKADGNTLVIVTADHETGGLSLTHRDTAASTVPRMQFSTKEHTGIAVPVFAYGPGAELFSGVYQNTEIFYKMVQLLNLK